MGRRVFFGKIKSGKWSWEASLKEKKRKSKEKKENKKFGMRGFSRSYMGKRRGGGEGGAFSRWNEGVFKGGYKRET